MKWMLIVVGSLGLLVVVVALIGATLPRTHVASRTLRVNRSPDDAWAAITSVMSAADVPTDVVESDPPRRLLTRVKETEKMFGGTWTVVIAPVADSSAGSGGRASTITITEDGWVANPIFRFVSRFALGHHATMDRMLRDVAKSFGEEAVLSGN